MKLVVKIFGLMLIMACSDESENLCGNYQSFNLNTAKTISVGEGKVVVELTKIEESRCPKDVSCIRAGEVKLEVKISSVIENNTESYNLCLGDCIDGNSTFNVTDTLASNIDDLEFKLVLHGVNPYPTSENVAPSTACFELLFE